MGTGGRGPGTGIIEEKDIYTHLYNVFLSTFVIPNTTSMKKLSFILLMLISLALFNRCSNDVDINASYEQITVVYGLLDPNDSLTYLKINKAFLGDDNALIMAQVPDSSQFPEKLDVRMWREDNPENIFYFDTTTITDKEDGIFYNPNQIVYVSPLQPEVDKKYMLSILYKGDEISSETSTFNFRMADITTPGFALKIRIDNTTDPKPVIWNRKEQAPRYNVTIRFHFKEVFEDSPDTVYRYIDWFKDTKKSLVGAEVESYYTGNTFYVALETYVPYPDEAEEARVLSRYTSTVQFIVEAGGTELNTYMEVNEPSSSIIQERPEYTNITNGIGILSARIRAIKPKKLNDITVAYIKENYYQLKFQY